MKAIALIRDGIFRISPIERIAGEPCLVTQVFLASPAVRAPAARCSEPRHANPVPHGKPLDLFPSLNDGTDDFVSRDHRELWPREIAV
jgi:hypothetical protein